MDKRIIFIIAIILSIGAFFVLPVDDDFYYFTAPHKYLNTKDLLPNGPFWRPFDVLWGIIMGKCPKMFPFLNHALVLVSYAYSVYGLNKLLNYCNISKISQNIAMAIFCLSPALVATTYSVDSSNQCISLALGIASLLYYQEHKFSSFILMILAVFTKESGIAWFVITPLLNMLIQHRHNNTALPIIQLKKVIRPWCISLCIIIVYAVTRLCLDTYSPQVEDTTSRYSGGIGFNSIIGLGMIFTCATTVIDTVALFLEKNWFVTIATSIVSIAGLIVYIKKINWHNCSNLLILFFCTLAISSPHLVIKHPGEMHIYPTLWMIALSIGILTSDAKWNKKETTILYVYFIIAMFVFVHKGYHIYHIGKIADARVRSAVEQTDKIPTKLLILDCDPVGNTYSVFQENGKRCWDEGKGTRIHWDLENPKQVDYKVIKPQELPKYLNTFYNSAKGKYDACWIVRNNKVKIVK